MRIRTFLALAGGTAVGFVFSSAAGRSRYEQLRQRAVQVLHSATVEQTVFDLAGHAKANAHRVPGPAASVVDAAATRVQDTLTKPSPDIDPAAGQQI